MLSGKSAATLDCPVTELWQTKVPKKQRLRIINQEDFPTQDLLQGLGLSGSSLRGSFGTSNEEEIRARLELVRFLLQHPDIMKFIEDHFMGHGYEHVLSQWIDMPTEKRAFMDYYNPEKEHNPFWQVVLDFIALCRSKPNIPSRLVTVLDFLEANTGLEEEEKEMAAVISDRLTNIAVIQGLAQFRVHVEVVTHNEYSKATPKKPLSATWETSDGDVPIEIIGYLGSVGDDDEEEGYVSIKDSDTGIPVSDIRWMKEYKIHLESHGTSAHGNQLYSFDLMKAKLLSYPEWLDWKWLPTWWLGISWVARSLIEWRNLMIKGAAFKEMVIENMPTGTLSDIEIGLIAKLKKLIPDFAREIHGSTVKLYFSYSKEGLRIHIYDLLPSSFSTIPKDLQPIDDFEWVFEGYSPERKRMIEEDRNTYCQTIYSHHDALNSARFVDNVHKQHPSFFFKGTVIPSPRTDASHKWFAINNLYRSALLRSTYNKLEELREFVRNHATILGEVAWILMTLREKAKKLGTVLSVPEIVTGDQHIVDFEEIYPIHLLPYANREKLVPIRSLPSINGQVVGLTGTHGGGKTVTGQTLVEFIYLAQSGLPILGKGLKLNIKRILGIVFIERGSGGSTCQTLVKKIANIFKAIKGKDGNQIVVFLDELGTGTQEDDGLDLGKDVLAALQRRGVSVIFSTQITDLARYAQLELGAECLQFDAQHRISKGIGTGQLTTLRKTSGLDRYLN